MENNLPIQNETAPRPKRLLLYVHYDRDGQVDPHVVYQIKALHDFGISIIFISNSPVSEEDKQILSPFIKELNIRSNEGYDFTAWKEAILALGIEGLSKYDELILMNDSCYGPVFPLEEMFSKMDKEEVDFWGITENTNPNFVEHIQSFFCVFKNKMFTSHIFIQFWKNLKKLSRFSDVILNGELCMTKYFHDNGYHYSVYAKMENMFQMPQIGVEQPFVYSLAPWLVRNYRIPFVKIKAFRTEWGKLFTMGQELFVALEDCNSKYPAHLIINHLHRTRPLSWQKNLPGTLAVVDENTPVYPDPGLKIAVFAHLFYVAQAEEAVGWLSNIPYLFDLYVSTSSADKARTIRRIAESNAELRAQKIEIRVMEDRGRDVAPWLLGFKDVQNNYDIALKFHLKKRPEPNPIFAWQWNNFILKNTLASAGYISSIINMFNTDKNLGTVFHAFPPVLILYQQQLDGSKETIDWKNNILERFNCNSPKETSWSVYSNNIFWYRPKSLINLFNGDINIKEFPEEPLPIDGTIAHGIERTIPYLVQGNGYKYKLIITSRDLYSAFQHYEDYIMNIKKSKKENSKYYRRDPQNIPIGRAAQVFILSLYGHIIKFFKKRQKNKQEYL